MAEIPSFMEHSCGYPRYFAYAVIVKAGGQIEEPSTTCPYVGLEGQCENTFALNQQGRACMLGPNGQQTYECASMRDERVVFTDSELAKRAALAWRREVFQRAYGPDEENE